MAARRGVGGGRMCQQAAAGAWAARVQARRTIAHPPLPRVLQGRGFREPMDVEDRLRGGDFEALPADRSGGPGPAKCERAAAAGGGRAPAPLPSRAHALLAPCRAQRWRAGWSSSPACTRRRRRRTFTTCLPSLATSKTCTSTWTAAPALSRRARAHVHAAGGGGSQEGIASGRVGRGERRALRTKRAAPHATHVPDARRGMHWLSTIPSRRRRRRLMRWMPRRFWGRWALRAREARRGGGTAVRSRARWLRRQSWLRAPHCTPTPTVPRRSAGRAGHLGIQQRPAAQGAAIGSAACCPRRQRCTCPPAPHPYPATTCVKA